MGIFFSKKKPRDKKQKVKPKGEITAQDRAVLDLKNARDRLHKYQKKLEVELETLHDRAKALLKEGKQDKAKLVLKIRKMKDAECKRLDNQLLNILQMVQTVEWETENVRIVNAMQEGTAALNKIHETLTVEKIEEVMADTEEAFAVAEEINQAFSEGAKQAGGLDEAELDEEFEQMLKEYEAEESKTQASSVPGTPAKVQVQVPQSGAKFADKEGAEIPFLPDVPQTEAEVVQQSSEQIPGAEVVNEAKVLVPG